MKTFLSWLAFVALLAPARGELIPREWTVEGVKRQGLLSLPPVAREQAAPVVFVFHGHGGGAAQVARQFAVEKLWPEALVVYLQGLPTPGRLTDPQGEKPGWQPAVGEQGDRDLKLFDAVLAGLRAEYRVDPKRLYATGHSNGGGFTYVLWRARGTLLAAVAPSAAVTRDAAARLLPPKPVLHLAGSQDTLVKFAWQQRTMETLRALNGCGPEGQPWGPGATRYSSPGGPPVVTYIHPGTHQFPAEGPPLIVKFFQEHTLP